MAWGPVAPDFTQEDYQRADWMLGQADLPPKKRPDVVDTLVVVTAVLHRTDVIVTTDPEDIAAYGATLGRKLDLVTV